jgi:hypothetical protein
MSVRLVGRESGTRAIDGIAPPTNDDIQVEDLEGSRALP